MTTTKNPAVGKTVTKPDNPLETTHVSQPLTTTM